MIAHPHTIDTCLDEPEAPAREPTPGYPPTRNLPEFPDSPPTPDAGEVREHLSGSPTPTDHSSPTSSLRLSVSSSLPPPSLLPDHVDKGALITALLTTSDDFLTIAQEFDLPVVVICQWMLSDEAKEIFALIEQASKLRARIQAAEQLPWVVNRLSAILMNCTLDTPRDRLTAQRAANALARLSNSSPGPKSNNPPQERRPRAAPHPTSTATPSDAEPESSKAGRLRSPSSDFVASSGSGTPRSPLQAPNIPAILAAMTTADDAGPSDCFAPPKEPLVVHCIECGQEYESSRIWFDTTSPTEHLDGVWRCATPNCGGIGYGFDIYPADGSPGGLDGGWFDDDGNPCDPPWLSGD